MKIILLKDIENVGKKYEVKEVKNGYARNFLIPQNMAKLATKKAIQWLQGQKEILAKEVEEDLKKAQELASKLDDVEVNIAVRVGSEGQLFESVNSAKIAEKLKEMGFEVKKSQINLEKPIKEAGEFPISITLNHNLEVQIMLIIIGEKE